jgi:GT2 family glycosyltransferase
MNAQPVATIVIVSYRTPALASACAVSAIQRTDVPFHVRVIDTSGGPGALVDQPVGLQVEYEPNIGYAAALRMGFEGAQTPLLIACNADVEFPTDGIGPFLELFDEHRDVGLIGPRQVSPDGRIAHAGVENLGDIGGGRDYGQPDTGQHTERLVEVPQVSGSVMLIRRTAYEAVGGFALMPRLYFEDATLCSRMVKGGWKVAYSGLRTFIHHVQASPPPPEGRAALAQEAFKQFAAEVRL